MNKITPLGVYTQTTMVGLTYLGEESLAMDETSKPATLPPGTNMVEISAEGGPVRFSINGEASVNSGGYIPSDQTRYVLKLDNLVSLSLFGAAPAVAHLIYILEQ